MNSRVPIILGTPTIGQVVNVMNEAEMDALVMPWVNAMAAHLLAVRRMAPITVESDCDGGCITRQDGFMMCTQNVETLEPFSSHVIPIKMMETHAGKHINVMVQVLHNQVGTLPPGLTIQNMYTELRKGSSGGAKPQHLSPNSSEKDASSEGDTSTFANRGP